MAGASAKRKRGVCGGGGRRHLAALKPMRQPSPSSLLHAGRGRGRLAPRPAGRGQEKPAPLFFIAVSPPPFAPLHARSRPRHHPTPHVRLSPAGRAWSAASPWCGMAQERGAPARRRKQKRGRSTKKKEVRARAGGHEKVVWGSRSKPACFSTLTLAGQAKQRTRAPCTHTHNAQTLTHSLNQLTHSNKRKKTLKPAYQIVCAPPPGARACAGAWGKGPPLGFCLLPALLFFSLLSQNVH